MLARGQRSAGYLNINEVVWLDSSRMRQRWMEVITIHKLGLAIVKLVHFAILMFLYPEDENKTNVDLL